MSSFRYIVPALAIAGGAAAATCSVDSTTTIQNQGDATALASCQTFSGSIAIATGTTDNIDLSGIQVITGSLDATSVTSLTTIMSSTLNSIQDTFDLENLQLLSTLNFPSLTTVKNIKWIGLPALNSLSFGTSGVQMASTVDIENTHLQALDGINLQQVDQITIANNNYLTRINMQLANVTDFLQISANGQNVSASFPNLISAQNMTIANVSDFSIPSLASVNGSLGYYSDFFSSVTAPNLTIVKDSLSVVSCPSLSNLSFPVLTTVGGGLTVANNTALKSIDGFPSLQTVGGAIDYYGNFSNASLPSLKSVAGAFNVQSTADLTSTCNSFNSFDQTNGVVAGQYNCTGQVATPSSGPAGNGGTATGSAPAQSSTKNAAGALQIPAMTGVLGLVAAIFGML